MKKILFFLIIPITMNAQNKYQENAKTADLKGSVKQLIKLCQNEYGNSKEIYEFDEFGNIITQKNFNKNNKLTSNFINVFNTINFIVKKTDLITGDTWTYEYDSDNRLVKNIKKNSNDVIANTISLEYINGLLTCETVKSEFGTCWKYYFEHDSKNRVIKETEKSCNGKLEGIVECTYNDNNLKVLEKNFDETGKFSYSVELKYNEKEDQTYSKTTGEFGNETFFQYDYDTNNNWIRQFTVVDGQKKLHYERQIIYY